MIAKVPSLFPDWDRQMTEWLNARLHHKGSIGEGIRPRLPVS